VTLHNLSLTLVPLGSQQARCRLLAISDGLGNLGLSYTTRLSLVGLYAICFAPLGRVTNNKTHALKNQLNAQYSLNYLTAFLQNIPGLNRIFFNRTAGGMFVMPREACHTALWRCTFRKVVCPTNKSSHKQNTSDFIRCLNTYSRGLS